MKSVARTGAGLSFAFFLLAGVTILVNVDFRGPRSEVVLPAALGFFLVGAAFFAESLLWLSAEKWAGIPPGGASEASGRGWPWKLILTVFCAIIGVIVVLPLLRLLHSAVASLPAIVP